MDCGSVSASERCAGAVRQRRRRARPMAPTRSSPIVPLAGSVPDPLFTLLIPALAVRGRRRSAHPFLAVPTVPPGMNSAGTATWRTSRAVLAHGIGPLHDAAAHRLEAPGDVCDRPPAPLETGIGIQGDQRDLLRRPQPALREKLRRGGRRGGKERDEKRVQARRCLLPIREDKARRRRTAVRKPRGPP